MNQKNDLFKELKLDQKEQDVCSPLDIDIQRIKRNVHAKLDSAYTERKSVTMKSKKRVSLIAIAAALVLGITAFAANGIVANWFSSSSSIPDYKSLPTAQQVIKDIGYVPVLIDTFENGYTFKNGCVVNNNLTDEGGNSVEKFKSVSFDYAKDGDTLYFSQDRFSSQTALEGDVVKTVGDTELYYFSYTNKVVPADYELTEEDKRAEESGELVFSYGSSEVEIKQVQSVTWTKDGVQYQLLQIDGRLSPEELAGMAEEVLNRA